MAKYAVFVDDGFNKAFDTKDKAKSYASKMRDYIRSIGRKDSCYFKKMTQEQEEIFLPSHESKRRDL